MSKLNRLGIRSLVVLLVVGIALGGMIGCSSDSGSEGSTGSAPPSDSGGGEEDAAREVCTVECLGLGHAEGSSAYRECMEECKARKN